MNPHVKLATVTQSEISPAEWQARVDLAATYRLIAPYGWADVIYNIPPCGCRARSANF